MPVEDGIVRCAGLGSKMDVIVLNQGVFVRGDSELLSRSLAHLNQNELGQLSDEGIASTEEWIKLDVPCTPSDIVAVHCSRSSTILEIKS